MSLVMPAGPGDLGPVLTTSDTGHLRDIGQQLGLMPSLVISAVLVMISPAILVSFCVRGQRFEIIILKISVLIQSHMCICHLRRLNKL